MSTPLGSGPVARKGGDRRMSLGKYVKRMSSVFKREKTGMSIISVAPAAPSVQVKQQAVQEEGRKEELAPSDPATPKALASAISITPKIASTPVVTTRPLDRNTMQQERARALFAKYGLTLESHEWIPGIATKPVVQRVEKSIRMRVHRSCHHCGSLYGQENVCLECEHKQCKKCPRYPQKKLPLEKEKKVEMAIAEKPKRKRVLTVTTSAGNELAYQSVKQRVRRSCHKCETVFVPPTATICEQCRHIRCTKCPREPAKLQKWPIGYPGDADAGSDSEVEKQLEKFRRTWRKPRQKVRWECEHCNTLFISGSPRCSGCGHERCDRCTRSPLKKVKIAEQFDPELVAAVEAKLRALGVDKDPTTSDPEAVY